MIDGIRSVDSIECSEVLVSVTTRILATMEDQLPFMATIHRNILIMSSKHTDSKDPYESKLATAKEEINQSILILHALKAGRKINELLFSRDSSSHLPSLTTPTGNMYHGTKADLI